MTCLLNIMVHTATLEREETDLPAKFFARRWAEFQSERGVQSSIYNAVTPETAEDAVEAAVFTTALLFRSLDLLGQTPEVTFGPAMADHNVYSLHLASIANSLGMYVPLQKCSG